MAAPKTPNTAPARVSKRRRRVERVAESGDLAALRLKLWQAVTTAEGLMLEAADGGDAPGALRAVHALTQAGGAYAKAVEVGELEGRLAELEKALDAQAGTPGARPYTPAHARA